MKNQSPFRLPLAQSGSHELHSRGAQGGVQQAAFILATWALSRLLIVVVMQWIAPHLSIAPWESAMHPIGYSLQGVPKPGWDLFTHWDGKWYEMIATKGYEYGADYATKRYSISFPPLYSLVTYLVMQMSQQPFAIAGTLVNNVAFLGAMWTLYGWVHQNHGPTIAKWATIALAWCPYSLFGTTAYTEGLFFLTTVASLRSFEQKQYGRAALWGALATTARFFGTALIPTFLIVAWREKRSPIAYVAALSVGLGWCVFLAYCGWKFGDVMAPFRSQIPWAATQETWRNVFVKLLIWRQFSIDQMLKIVMFFGGGYLFWHFRKQLSLTTLTYAFCYLGTLLAGMSTDEVSRYCYANVALSVAMGFWLAQHRRWRLWVLALFVVKMVELTIRFVWWYAPL